MFFGDLETATVIKAIPHFSFWIPSICNVMPTPKSTKMILRRRRKESKLVESKLKVLEGDG
jgi:hypothetical protein